MTMQIKPFARGFGAEVTGVDLANISPEDNAAFYQAYLDHSFLVVKDQKLTVPEHIEFSKQFGPLLMLPKKNSLGIQDPEIDEISNIGPDGEIEPPEAERQKFKEGNKQWHTDMSFLAVPATASLLYCHEAVARDGGTEYADMYAAYDELPEDRKAELEGLIAEHTLLRSRLLGGMTEDEITDEMREKFPGAPQPIVRIHPETGRKMLFLSGDAYSIHGMDQDKAERLIEDLIEFSTHPRFTHVHRWTPGDLVIWDNRSTMHRGLPYEARTQRRHMHRTTAMGTMPTVVDGVIAVGV